MIIHNRMSRYNLTIKPELVRHTVPAYIKNATKPHKIMNILQNDPAVIRLVGIFSEKQSSSYIGHFNPPIRLMCPSAVHQPGNILVSRLLFEDASAD